MEKTCENCKYYVLRHCGEYGCWNKQSEYFGDNPKVQAPLSWWDKEYKEPKGEE